MHLGIYQVYIRKKLLRAFRNDDPIRDSSLDVEKLCLEGWMASIIGNLRSGSCSVHGRQAAHDQYTSQTAFCRDMTGIVLMPSLSALSVAITQIWGYERRINHYLARIVCYKKVLHSMLCQVISNKGVLTTSVMQTRRLSSRVIDRCFPKNKQDLCMFDVYEYGILTIGVQIFKYIVFTNFVLECSRRFYVDLT